MGLEDVTGDQVRAAVGKRAEFLAAVEDEPRRKPALVDELDVSRSTVDRAIADLTDVGLVEREEGVYHATVSGVLARQMYADYVEQTDALATATPIVNAVQDAERLDPVILKGADIHVADPHAPESTLERAITELRQSDTLRGFVHVVKSTYISLLHEQVLENDLEAEVIVQRDARDSLGALTHGRDQLVDLFMTDAFTVLETDEQLPYALWLMEGDTALAGLTIHNTGGIVGMLINDTDDAVDWCRAEYERVRGSADELPPNLLG